MMSCRKRVLCLMNVPARWGDQLHLVDGANNTNDFEFLFVVPAIHWDRWTERHPERAGESRCLTKRSPGQSGSVWIMARRLRERLARHMSFGQYWCYRSYKMALDQEYAGAGQVFDDFSPGLVLVVGDRHLHGEASVLKVARERAVPTVIPYMVCSFPEAQVFLRRDRNQLRLNARSTRFSKEVYRQFPEQEHGGVFFYSAEMTRALAEFGGLSDNPWVMGGGSSDVVCVDSEMTRSRYVAAGVSEGKLKVVGDIAYEQLHAAHTSRDQLREDLVSEYGLSKDKKTLVVAMPQFWEHGLADWGTHWRLAQQLVEQISESGCNILLSLHPKMELARYTPLEAKYACRIVRQRLFELLPIADVFVGTFSSTIFWAILCGIPAVVTDPLRMNYPIFDELEHVTVVHAQERIGATIRSILSTEHDFSGDGERLSRELVFDDGLMERYRQLFLRA